MPRDASLQDCLSSIGTLRDKGSDLTEIPDYEQFRGFHVNKAGDYRVFPVNKRLSTDRDFVIMSLLSGQDVFIQVKNILNADGTALDAQTGNTPGDITLLGW